MTARGDRTGTIEYVVGEEKRLDEILAEREVGPLLLSAVRSGASRAAITDADGNVLWAHGTEGGVGDLAVWKPLSLEGEVVGRVVVSGPGASSSSLHTAAGLLFETVATLARNSLKRMLTAEIHAKVVDQTYEELLETNRRLSLSEGRYRELAETLEIKVRERTEELSKAHARLLQQEKMASIGQLAAGVAHEINNPLGFIISNLNTLKKYAGRITEGLEFYRNAVENGGAAEDARRKREELRLDFVLADLDALLVESLDGAGRVRKIVADLKGFSHVDDAGEGVVDLNAEIDRTLRVLARQVPAGAEILRDYRPLPGYPCRPASMCQVLLNILLNAFEARREGLILSIGTSFDGEAIRLLFSDNGPGIPAQIRGRIFEPFFTTKEVGRGTGMGLTVAYDVVSACGGTIAVDCPPGGGTTFVVTLPTKGA